MSVSTYNAKDWAISVAGKPVTGLGEDIVSVEKEEALAENSVGAQGDVVRSIINNPIYNISITVQSTSPSFQSLMALKDGSLVSISVASKALGFSATGSKACLLELPELSYGSTAEDVEFTFCVYDCVLTVG